MEFGRAARDAGRRSTFSAARASGLFGGVWTAVCYWVRVLRVALLTGLHERCADARFHRFCARSAPLECTTYDRDCSDAISVSSDKAVALALRSGNTLLIFVGSTDQRSLTVALRVDAQLSGTYRREHSTVYAAARGATLGPWTRKA